MMINGITIKTPTKLRVGVFRIAGRAERTASGKMVMDIIAIKRKLYLEWEIIEESELKKIMDTLESRTFHTVTYPDPQKGENHTITAYVGDMDQEAWQKISGTRYWRNVSFSLIEQ